MVEKKTFDTENTSQTLDFKMKWLKLRIEIALTEAMRPQACNFIKKETLAQVFSCEFCEIFKNTFFIEHL